MPRLALIGCGKWGKNYLTTAAANGINISAICDTNLAESDPGINAFRDYTEIKDVDGVIVATPPDIHKRIACHFLNIGKPVLVEKPVALSLSDTLSVFEAATTNKTPVLINNIHLFAHAFEILKDNVAGWQGSLNITSIGGNSGPYRDYSALFDWGPHDISMCLALFECYPHYIRIMRGKCGGGEIYTIVLKRGSYQARLTVGNGLIAKKREFKVTSTEHNIEYDDLADDKLILDGNPCPVESASPLARVLRGFVKCIETGETDWRFSHNLNIDIMRVLEECRLQLVTKHPDILELGLPPFHSGK